MSLGPLMVDIAGTELSADDIRVLTHPLVGSVILFSRNYSNPPQVAALTASELRVAQMAAQGLTNRQIAQALFITMRTVSAHLGHVYSKLDISDRAQLPAVLSVERTETANEPYKGVT